MVKNYGHTGFPILFYGNNVAELGELLSIQPVEYRTTHFFSTSSPQALLDILNNLTQPVVLTAIAGAITAWLAQKTRRSVKIILKDGTTIETKAISAKEFAKHLESAAQIIAMDNADKE